MNWRSAILFVGSRLLVVLVVGALVGLVGGGWWVGVIIGLAAALAWQWFNLHWLDSWLRFRSRIQPPDPMGYWGEVVSRVVQLHRRKSFHKQRMLGFFRELRRSTAAMPDGVVVLNAQAEIVWFNRMAVTLLKLRRSADIGIRITNLIRDPQLASYLQLAKFDEPLMLVPASVGGPQLSIQVIPYGTDQRLMLVRDVSRMVALETMRKDFVANASHELRTPLTVITGYVETLAHDETVDAATRTTMAEVQRQVERMNLIVRDLLELSRLDFATGEVGGEPIDVALTCEQLCKDHHAQGGLPAIQLELQSSAQLLGSATEIYSAWSNILGNARKYTPASGVVRVIWRDEPAGGARFIVEDTGAGIAPEHVSRLTERFFRVDAARSRDTGGTGLGLAIVKHILQHHGARLEVTSEPGKGSVFTCVFPARRVLRGDGQAATAKAVAAQLVRSV
jgi:two-component system, OmpR family, phosphate regulon sensor histidine kinase PhoR